MAPTDSQNPTDHTSSGSTTTSNPTDKASTRAGRTCLPSTYAVAAIVAITPARNTDGSKRVSAMNHAISATDAAQRHHGLRRRSNGSAAASTNATF